MPTTADWIAGARPRTLPAAVAPVIAGTGVAAYVDGAVWWKALLALVVSLALQVAVNYANDYSDGIRGTDDERVGPMRLVGSGRATPQAVKRAAFLAFGVAAAAGLAARGHHRLVAGRGRRGLRRGRVVLHRRRQALRLPRPRRGHGVRVLRAGGRGRDDVRPDGDVRARPRCTPGSGSARSPARSWSSTTCATSPPTRRPASARSRSGSARSGPAASTSSWCWRPRRRSSRWRPARPGWC